MLTLGLLRDFSNNSLMISLLVLFVLFEQGIIEVRIYPCKFDILIFLFEEVDKVGVDEGIEE